MIDIKYITKFVNFIKDGLKEIIGWIIIVIISIIITIVIYKIGYNEGLEDERSYQFDGYLQGKEDGRDSLIIRMNEFIKEIEENPNCNDKAIVTNSDNWVKQDLKKFPYKASYGKENYIAIYCERYEK